ncbi:MULTISPECIES: type VI secretion system Vgr family protein [unclassified Photorhabdus]|uniref:type VI secretion system Vgr family protein n=1 Tax=unclassified Photorhabdus TaxID=2620880 RepID=UPI000DCF51F1|nr:MULTISPECIES: type VI secretion system tip protein VgrG [unclassified Photorhabdus]RAW97492.1 type VI secretion system tip protein VgrG [Photorhabdus sp. S9-53]RAX00127.1 type VI secretion system tip protein VgrG [Photorhabdus sp. S10-54]RAX04460.1 type VI secretion system tip protein VgrG [Photorhabdus sp. S8-52]
MSFQKKTAGPAGNLAQQIAGRLRPQSAGGLQFTLTAGGLPPRTFVVAAFTLNEAFSTPFTLEVSLASADPAIDFAAVLDKSATLSILREGKTERTVTGMVAHFEQGTTGKHQTGYKMTVRPDMWRTTLRQNSRIFQQQDIQTIITTLLKENGVRDVVFSLRNPHPEREFCVQYRETDFDFLQRLAAEEGLFYFFEFSGNKNTLVFADDAGSVVKGPALPYHPGDAGQAQQLCITRLTRQAQVRPAVVELKDYTFKNPAWAAEFRHQMREQDLQHTGYEHFDFPGGFKDEQHGADFTRYRLEALRNNALTGDGESNAATLQPGVLFTLVSHPRDDLNRLWQLVSVAHQGSQPQALEQAAGESGTVMSNRFTFIPYNQHWRPAPLAKPVMEGPQIAKVAGPAGEEIYCDQYGRIRLQFLWDRYGRSNDNSSCWIRVTQPWAGQGWGMLAIPRIGQEVVVDFLNGDPDQPIVTGRTYHASNIPPGTLPGSKTQMALRSKTHKGEGYNELRFEDAKGSEELALHAQRDMNIVVLNNRETRVMNDHTESIGHNQVLSVRNDRHKEVTGNEVSAITGLRQITVEKDSLLNVKNNIQIHSQAGGIEIATSGGSITIDNAGNISIQGANITINGKQVNVN